VVSLAETNIGDKGLEWLFLGMYDTSALQKLDLSNNHIGCCGLYYMSEAVRHNRFVPKRLILRNNKIKCRGALRMTDAFLEVGHNFYRTKSLPLRELDLVNNWIGTQGAQALNVLVNRSLLLIKLDVS